MMTKAQIVPIISAVALVAQTLFHQQISQEMQDTIATFISDGFLLGTVIYGIIKKYENPTK